MNRNQTTHLVARSLAGICRFHRDIAKFVSVTLLLGLSVSPVQAKPKSNFLNPGGNVVAPDGARQLCEVNAWACSVSPKTGKILKSDMAEIVKVNRSVNRRTREVADITQFRVEEKWTLPTARGGDCEDFALLKKRDLIRLGYPAQSLLIATVLDTNRRGHAVLIVRTDKGDFVLDNLTDQIKSWSDTGYIFLRMQNPKKPTGWVRLASAT
ncbi:hypothetical protein DL239_14990 [Sedimentitalea sp. CY04]|uniref:Transglutaminase n=1 Tax=Parasedimentitalea denitrificans TaxID=2211118 RepID=A0ABX0W9F4_9RHOB|nr:transglutaminase-like cysteine peptidase [Sedimentitalea sp. CY04]NIZ62279.1 hypothetical protein [Sedimentitalea sp. CY04]